MAKLEVAEGCLYNKGVRARIRAHLPITAIGVMIQMAVMFTDSQKFSHALSRTILVAVICIAIELIRFYSRWVRRNLCNLGRNMREKLELRHRCVLSDAVHVGIAPGTKAVQYDADYSWDVGFLSVSDRVTYYGDQASFSLDTEQIRQVRVVRPFALSFQPRLQIQFAVQSQNGEVLHWLTIEDRESRSVTSQYATLQHLRSQIYLMPRLALTPALGMPPVVPVQRWLTAG
jgi:hypothetical protein